MLGDGCENRTNKKERAEWDTQPSHAHCPYVSSGLPVTVCLSGFWRIHEESLLAGFILNLSAALGSLKMMLIWNEDLRPQNKTETLHRLAPMCTQSAVSEICEEKRTIE